jgi:hypothetical protein
MIAVATGIAGRYAQVDGKCLSVLTKCVSRGIGTQAGNSPKGACPNFDRILGRSGDAKISQCRSGCPWTKQGHIMAKLRLKYGHVLFWMVKR